MSISVEAIITIPKTLLEQAETQAHQLGLSRDQLVEQALEHFLSAAQPQPPQSAAPRTINQGDLYWVQVDDGGAEPGIPHPHVILQDNLFNHSRIHTVVACALTTNLKRASLPGNILLEAGEGGLAKPSIVEVSKVSAIDKARLGAYIGTLSEARVQQILAGIRFLQTSFWKR